MCWTHRNALYKGILVVNAYYDKIENFMKIFAKMDTKSYPKIDIWAIRGPTFGVLGAFLRSLIFQSAKSLIRNLESHLGQGRRVGQRPSESFGIWQGLMRICRRSGQRVSHALPPKGGGGYSRAPPYPPTQKYKTCKKIKNVFWQKHVILEGLAPILS